MMIPTADAIRQMDGPALTRLAYALRLDEDPALPGWRWYLPRTTATHEALCFVDAQGEHWAPHRKLSQATEVFQGLRARGWKIIQRSQCTMEPATPIEFGVCKAFHLASTIEVISWWSTAARRDPEMDATEALCLLRCAVLAVAWAKQQQQGAL